MTLQFLGAGGGGRFFKISAAAETLQSPGITISLQKPSTRQRLGNMTEDNHLN